jgi:hypothetical protein
MKLTRTTAGWLMVGAGLAAAIYAFMILVLKYW